jgi:hypothetical protein
MLKGLPGFRPASIAPKDAIDRRICLCRHPVL